MMFNQNKVNKAFTLAEVLVTLAIIGIVAAMSIPSLVNSTGSSETVAKVRKYQSVFSQAAKRYMADNGCLDDMRVCGAFSGDADHDLAWTAFKPYFNVAKECGVNGTGCFNPGVMYKYLNGTDYKVMDTATTSYKAVLADGSFIAFWDHPGNCSVDDSVNNSGPLYNSSCGGFSIDINGKRGPNQLGRDVFAYRLERYGDVYPMGSLDDTSGGCDPASADVTTSVSDATLCPGNGTGCTAKIIQDGAVNY